MFLPISLCKKHYSKVYIKLYFIARLPKSAVTPICDLSSRLLYGVYRTRYARALTSPYKNGLLKARIDVTADLGKRAIK